jgi:hypothetical protein
VSDYEKIASAVLPPMEDAISAIAITTSASTAQDTGVNGDSSRYVTFISDIAFFVTFSNDGLDSSITDPDGTAVSGSGRTWLVPASTPLNVLVSRRSRYFKARGTGSGTLRWYTSSP